MLGEIELLANNEESYNGLQSILDFVTKGWVPCESQRCIDIMIIALRPVKFFECANQNESRTWKDTSCDKTEEKDFVGFDLSYFSFMAFWKNLDHKKIQLIPFPNTKNIFFEPFYYE